MFSNIFVDKKLEAEYALNLERVKYHERLIVLNEILNDVL